jgi:hypothetical protein
MDKSNRHGVGRGGAFRSRAKAFARAVMQPQRCGPMCGLRSTYGGFVINPFVNLSGLWIGNSVSLELVYGLLR